MGPGRAAGPVGRYSALHGFLMSTVTDGVRASARPAGGPDAPYAAWSMIRRTCTPAVSAHGTGAGASRPAAVGCPAATVRRTVRQPYHPHRHTHPALAAALVRAHHALMALPVPMDGDMDARVTHTERYGTHRTHRTVHQTDDRRAGKDGHADRTRMGTVMHGRRHLRTGAHDTGRRHGFQPGQAYAPAVRIGGKKWMTTISPHGTRN